MYFSKDEIKHIPEQAGVYKYYDQYKNLLYIGKAKNLYKRVASYFGHKNLPERTLRMIEQINSIFVTVTQSETEALILENNLIRLEHPKYNIIFKDDKSYPYIKISKHAYPRLNSFRGKNNDQSLLFGPYPNTHSLRENIQTLQRIFKLRTCEDSSFKNRSKPCMLYQIKRCSAPCVGLISAEHYQHDVQQAIQFLKGQHKTLFLSLEQQMTLYSEKQNYEQAAVVRDQISALSDLFKQQNIDIAKNINVDVIGIDQQFNKLCIAIGIVRNGKHLGYKYFIQDMNLLEDLLEIEADTTDTIEKMIVTYIQQQNDYIFQHTNKLRILSSHLNQAAWLEVHAFLPHMKAYKADSTHAKSWLDSAMQNAQLHLKQFLNNQSNTKQQILALKALLNLVHINPHIECFDISHTSGEFTKASCVVFQNGILDRKCFRHYNLELQQKSDDYEAMREAVFKRYKNSTPENLPDVILIDGGLGQVNSAIQVFESLNLPIHGIIGIAKGDKRKVGLETLIFADGRPSISPSLSDMGLILLTKIRDCAHDYAVLKMSIKRSHTQYHSELDQIDGVGAIKKKRLIMHFGGIQGIKQASVAELMHINGIHQELAERIYAHFH
jgi:excinuclease ABC subunit C